MLSHELKPLSCPKCHHLKLWEVRRDKQKCAHCKYEFRKGHEFRKIFTGTRASRDEAIAVIKCFFDGLSNPEGIKRTGIKRYQYTNLRHRIDEVVSEDLNGGWPQSGMKIQTMLLAHYGDNDFYNNEVVIHSWNVSTIKDKEVRKLTLLNKFEVQNGVVVTDELLTAKVLVLTCGYQQCFKLYFLHQQPIKMLSYMEDRVSDEAWMAKFECQLKIIQNCANQVFHHHQQISESNYRNVLAELFWKVNMYKHGTQRKIDLLLRGLVRNTHPRKRGNQRD